MFDAPTLGIMPSVRVASVHLFRHGQPETGPIRMCRGQADVALSALGLEQTERAAAWFHSRYGRPDRVYTSDLSRCLRLAEAVADGAPLTATAALREQDMGEWEGRTWEALTRADGAAVTAYWADYVHARPPGGESYCDAAERVVAWWNALVLGDERVVVVSHVGAIRALLSHWLGVPPDQALRWGPGYASHGRMLVGDAGVVVESFGEDAGG